MTTREEAIEVMNRLTKEIEGRRSMSRFVKDDPETKLYADALNVLGFLISPPEPTEGQVEAAAELVYEQMEYDGPSTVPKPAWVPRGNSLKQSEARRYASAVLRAMPLQQGTK